MSWNVWKEYPLTILRRMTFMLSQMSCKRSTLKTTLFMQRFVSSCNTCATRDLSSSYHRVSIENSAEMIFFDHES